MNIPALSTQMAAATVAQQVSISAIRRAMDQMEQMGDILAEMLQATGPVHPDAGTFDVSI